MLNLFNTHSQIVITESQQWAHELKSGFRIAACIRPKLRSKSQFNIIRFRLINRISQSNYKYKAGPKRPGLGLSSAQLYSPITGSCQPGLGFH